MEVEKVEICDTDQGQKYGIFHFVAEVNELKCVLVFTILTSKMKPLFWVALADFHRGFSRWGWMKP